MLIKPLSEAKICQILKLRLQKLNPRLEKDMTDLFKIKDANKLTEATCNGKYLQWQDGFKASLGQLNRKKRNDIIVSKGELYVIIEVKATNYLFSGLSNKLTSAGVHSQLLSYALRLGVLSQETKKLQLLVVLPDNFRIKESRKLYNLGIDVQDHKQAVSDFISMICSDIADRVQGNDVQIQSRLMFYKNEDDINLKTEHSKIINY